MSASSIHDFSISGKEYKLFLQPIQFTSETEWVIGGLLSDRRYQSEKKQLPFRAILLLITLAVCLFVTAPWIKLFHMGNKDRLTAFDGVSSSLVSMLLVSMLFLSFFKYNLPFRTDNSPDSKKNLADNINAAFKKEIDSVSKKLLKYNSILKNSKGDLAQDIVYKNGTFSFFDGNQLRSEDASRLSEIHTDTSIVHLFWLKSNGDEIFKWTKDSLMPPHANFSARQYFKRIRDKKTYSLKSQDDTTKFFLDQVISWTSGAFTSVLSMPYSEDGDTVSAISFKASSLANTILPAGYQFALIDQSGDVLYHSQSSHNLNENLLDKFSASKELQSSLNAHSEATFLTDYLSRKYNVKVKPLTELPYSIVILSDTGFKETRDLEIYTFTFTMMVLFFAFLILEMLIIFFASARRSFFKKQLYDSSWVGPKRSGHVDYLLSAAFNVIVIIALIIFFSSPSFLTYGFMLLLAVSFLTLFLNLLYLTRYLIGRSNKYLYKVVAIACLTTIVIIINFLARRTLDPGHFVTLFLSELIFVLIGAIILFFRRSYLKRKQLKKGEQDQNVEMGKTRRSFLNQKYYINSFTAMLLTRLVITSGIPVVFFYIGSYNFEQNLITRYKQAEFANRLAERLPSDSLKAMEFIRQRPAIYTDSAWIKDFDTTHDFSGIGHSSKEDTVAIKLLSNFRPDATNEAITEKRFYNLTASDSLLLYNSIMNDARVQDTTTVMYRKSNSPGVNLKIISRGLNYNFPILIRYHRGTLFWVFLVLAYLTFFFLVRTIIKKLFAINMPDLSKWKQLDERILCDNRLNHLAFVLGSPGSKKKKNLLEKIDRGYITGRDNKKLIYKEDSPPDNNVFIADLINIPDSDKDANENASWENYRKQALDERYKLVIVNHFEYNIENQTTNRIKLNFLESLMVRDKTKIIILSTIHPMAFLDSIFFNEKKKNGEASIPREDLDRWNILLGHYRIVLLPLEPFPLNETSIKSPGQSTTLKPLKDYPNAIYEWNILSHGENEMDNGRTTADHSRLHLENLKEGVYEFELKITDDQGNVVKENKIVSVHRDEKETNDLLHRLVCSETEKTEFLNKMRFEAIAAAHSVAETENIPEKELNADELAYKLQFTSHYFYLYMWQSLTKEEKFLLYDLAEDNLVNSVDSYNLSMLIGKGIVYRDKEGTLKIFNKGFRNFILTAIGISEAMKIKDRIRDNGNWGKWKAPLIIILVAILIFLMVSQEDTYTKLLAYVGALGAAIPIFLRLLSFLDKTPQKSG